MTARKFAAAPAALAALSLFATPAAAADMPVQTSRSAIVIDHAWSPADEVAEGHRRYRGWRGYRGYRGYRHRNRTSVGDVLAGVLIIGGIAAVANAANKNRYRDRDYRRDDDRPRYRRSDYRDSDVRGIDRAVSMCVREIERDVRVDDVNSVDRNGDGWLVTGTLYNGDGFACSIGRDGRIDNVDFGGRGARFEDDRGERFDASARPDANDRQYDDARYQTAWADVDDAAPTPVARADAPAPAQAQPAYPGGPIDGDLSDDEIGTGYQGAGN